VGIQEVVPRSVPVHGPEPGGQFETNTLSIFLKRARRASGVQPGAVAAMVIDYESLVFLRFETLDAF
jgi:hypothetical protein